MRGGKKPRMSPATFEAWRLEIQPNERYIEKVSEFQDRRTNRTGAEHSSAADRSRTESGYVVAIIPGQNIGNSNSGNGTGNRKKGNSREG